MSDILDKFNILNGIDEQLKEGINSFRIHQYLNQTNQLNFKVLFATNTNQVFTFSSEQPEPQLIAQQINAKQFIFGTDFVLVHTREGQVFGWGHNQLGQLGRGDISQDNQEDVQRVQQLNHIEEVCCGDSHSLALDQQGRVYGWGDNRSGQVGCGQQLGEIIDEPIPLNLPGTVRKIYCSRNHSFAITSDGKVYSWGSNESFNLGHNTNQTVFEPTLIESLAEVRITSICCSEQTYFLSENNQIYFCGPNTGIDHQGQVVQPFNHQVQIDDLLQSLHAINYYNEDNQLVREVVALSERHIYLIEFNEISEFNSLFDYCLQNTIQITHKTIDLTYEQRFPQRFLINDKGYSARVYRAEDTIRCSEIAIKVFKQEYIDKYKRERIIREVTHMQRCAKEYVVQCYGYRFEQQDHFYIILELCSNDLKHIIEVKPQYFNRDGDQILSFWEYMISWLLFEEIVDCINHLHETQEMIHGDITPGNILVKYESSNQRFLKVTDFGFAVPGNDINQTYERWIGTKRYSAPEVDLEVEGTGIMSSYSNKADIYSLGILASDLFDLNINDNQLNQMENIDNDLMEKLQQMKVQLNRMRSGLPNDRPKCTEIRDEFEKLRLDKFKVFKQFKIENNWAINEQNDQVYRFFNEFISLKLNILCDEFETLLEEVSSGPGTFTKFRDDGNHVYYIYVAQLQNTSDENKDLLNEHQENVKRVHKEREKYLSNYHDHFIYNSYLCIKMDYFEINLKTIINEKQRCFGRNPSDPMSIVEYFFSSCLIKEVIECVQSLHKNHIKHCDLTPFNIMVNEIPNNNVPDNSWFLKLANIGLTTFSPDFQIKQTINEENIRYLAPEIISGTIIDRYTTAADIYSLGQIFCNLFDIDIYSSTENMKYDSDEYLNNKWLKLIELIRSTLNANPEERPSCDHILTEYNKYAIDNISELIKRKSSESYKVVFEKIKQFENQFFYLYVREKFIGPRPF